MFFVGRLFLFIALTFVFAGVLDAVLSFAWPLLIYDRDIPRLVGKFLLPQLYLCIGCLCAAGIVLRLEGCGWKALEINISGRWRDVFEGFVWALLLYAVGFGASLAMGWVKVVDAMVDVEMLLLTWVFFLLVSVFEEVLVRGYVLGGLLRLGVHPVRAVLSSAILFAVLHVGNPNLTWLSMLNLALAGVFLGLGYLHTRNLWFPISLHLFWNWLQGPVLGYEVSGVGMEQAGLKLELSDATLWNGGAFGFEGSLVCTLLLIIACWLLGRRCNHRLS